MLDTSTTRPGFAPLPTGGAFFVRAGACATVLADRAYVGHVAMSFGYVMSCRVVVPLVEAQVLLKLLGVGTFDHDCLDCCLEQFLIHYVGSGDHHREWSPVALDQDRLLGAVLGRGR